MTNAAIQIVTPRTLAKASRPTKAKHGEGSVAWHRGKAQVRLSLGPLGRRTFPLPTGTTERQAEERRTFMAQMARELVDAGQIGAGLPLLERAAGAADARALQSIAALARKVARGEAVMKADRATTVRELGQRWTSGELSRAYPAHIKVKVNAAEDAACFERYVYPVAGDVPVSAFTLDHADQIMARIPCDRAQNTRRNIAVKVHRLLALAVYPLRLLAVNPLPPGFLPKPGVQKAKTYLYPAEDAVLLACVDIPLVRRAFYGFLSREGMREGEALALRWTDLDLVHGAVRLDANKTDDARTWALDPGVLQALLAWRSICEEGGKPGTQVFPGIAHNRAADFLRADLRLAGVTRAELFETSKTRQPIRVHDLRATFVTLALANDRTEGWISARTGHRSSVMIARYRRAASTVAELHLGRLAPMAEAIPELRGTARESGQGSADTGAAVPDEGDGRPRGGGPAVAATVPAGGRRSQSLDPRIGSTDPKGASNGREPPSGIQNSAEKVTARDARDGLTPLQNRPTRVRIPSSPLILNPAESQKKTASGANGEKTENVLADPIRSQSTTAGAAESHEGAPRIAPAAPRVTMVRELAAGLAESFAAGDVDAAAVAFDAIGRLLGR